MKKILLVLVALLLAALVGGFLWVRSWLTPERIRPLVQDAVRPHYSGQLTLGDVGLAFPLALAVDEVAVADPSGKTRYVHLPSIRASLDPWALLEKKVAVTTFALDGATIDFVMTPEGSLEMLKWLPTPEGPTPTSKDDPLEPLVVEDLRVSRATIRVLRPGAEPMVFGPLDGQLALTQGDLEIRGLTVDGLDGAISAEVTGFLRDLAVGVRLDGLAVKARARVPAGMLDPAVHGGVEGEVHAALTLSGTPASLKGAGDLTADAITWTPPDPALAPLRAGPMKARLEVAGTSATVKDLDLGLLGGRVTGGAELNAVSPGATLAISGVKAGSWIGPALLARGLGEPMPSLTIDARSLRATPAGMKLAGAKLAAGGLVVSGDLGLLQDAKKGLGFTSPSKLAGTFEGKDLSSALALPNFVLEGPLQVDMDLAGGALAPTISGRLAGPAITVRRPQGFAVPTKDLAGTFRYQDGVATIPDLGIGVFTGRVTASARLELAAVPPRYSGELKAADLGLPVAVQQLFSAEAFRDGVLSLGLRLSGAGSDPMALSAEGTASLDRLRPTSSAAFGVLAAKTSMPKLADPRLRADVKSVRIENGRLELGGFEGDTQGFGPVKGAWSVGLDQTLGGKLRWDLLLNPEEYPELKGKTLPVDLQLGGTVQQPEVKIGDIGTSVKAMLDAEAKAKLAAKADKAVDKAAEKLGDALQGKLGDKLQELGIVGDKEDGSREQATEGAKQGVKGLLRGLFR